MIVLPGYKLVVTSRCASARGGAPRSHACGTNTPGNGLDERIPSMTCAPWRHPLVSNVSASPYLTLQGCCCGPPPGASGLQGKTLPRQASALEALSLEARFQPRLFQGFLSLEPQGRGDEIFAGAEHRFSAVFRQLALSGSGTRTDGGLTLDKASQACLTSSLVFHFTLGFLASSTVISCFSRRNSVIASLIPPSRSLKFPCRVSATKHRLVLSK